MNCSNCIYAIKRTGKDLLSCSNRKSDNYSEFVGEENKCKGWKSAE